MPIELKDKIKSSIPTDIKKSFTEPEDIFQQVKVNPESVELSPVQKENYKVLYYAGILLIVAMIIIFGDFISQTIMIRKTIPDEVCKINTDECLEIYKTIHEYTSERFIKIFDVVITKSILPIATTILGYAIGTNSIKSSK